MKKIELMPCPYCGKSVARIVSCCENSCKDDDTGCEFCGMKTVAVCCDFTKGGCGATGGYRKTEKEAIEAWEERAQK